MVVERPNLPWAETRRSGEGRSGIEATLLEDIAALEFHEAVSIWDSSNFIGAIRLFGRSAQKGHEVGEYCYRWGLYHELPPSDMVQALRWYSRGARLLHKGCTTMVGKMHLAKGDLSKASEWLQKTAAPNGTGGEFGDSLAQWFLAELKFNSGELRDAVRWWKRSAENGDVDAMMRLAEVFAQGGKGIPQEARRGAHWLLAAAAHGHQVALSRISLSNSSSRKPKAEQKWFDYMQDLGWF